MYNTGGYSIDVTKILAIKDPSFKSCGPYQDPEIVIVEVVMTGGVTIKLEYKLKDYRNKQFEDENFSLMEEANYAINELEKRINKTKKSCQNLN